MKPLKALLLAVMLLPFLAHAQNSPPKPKHSGQQTSKQHHENGTVRGVTFEMFKQSVSDFADSTKASLAMESWNLWKAEKWADLEKLFTSNNLNGGWPPNKGATSLKIVTMDTGWVIDRYGGYYDADSVFQDKGTFVSMKGVPFPERALPSKTLNSPYRVYKIIKAIPGAKEGGIIPWFGQPGLGIQYELPYSINDLKKEGYLQPENNTP